MLIIYTGNGKGKTTASLGLALRASGYDKKICILQFVKQESWPEGARIAIRKNLKNITIKALGTGFVGIMGDTKPKQTHIKAAQGAIKESVEAISSGKYDLIILDELLGALKGKLITKADVQLILDSVHRLPSTVYRKTKPAVVSSQSTVDLVLTGRHAPKWLIDKADLVTEMKEIKHPFQKGIQAKRGIDF